MKAKVSAVKRLYRLGVPIPDLLAMFARQGRPTTADVGEWVIAHAQDFPVGLFAEMKGAKAAIFIDQNHYMELDFGAFSVLNAEGTEDDLTLDAGVDMDSILDKLNKRD